jgi:hypothetical protein
LVNVIVEVVAPETVALLLTLLPFLLHWKETPAPAAVTDMVLTPVPEHTDAGVLGCIEIDGTASIVVVAELVPTQPDRPSVTVTVNVLAVLTVIAVLVAVVDHR